MNGEPDEVWAEELASKLAGLDEVFLLLENVRTGRSKLSSEEEEAFGASADGADIPHQYARVITRLIEALERLPEFADSRGLRTLQALRLDLYALDEGSRPQRLTPVARSERPGTIASMRVFQAQVILCVRLLEEIGLSGHAARSEVAAIFSKHGHRGQQGDKLSPNTLFKWREAVLAPDGPHLGGRRMIERKLNEWRTSEEWPPTPEGARAFIESRAANPSISLAHSK